MLAGSMRLLEETHPAVLCEVHNTEAGLEIAHRLAGLDYEIAHTWQKWRAPSLLMGEEMIQIGRPDEGKWAITRVDVQKPLVTCAFLCYLTL